MPTWSKFISAIGKSSSLSFSNISKFWLYHQLIINLYTKIIQQVYGEYTNKHIFLSVFNKTSSTTNQTVQYVSGKRTIVCNAFDICCWHWKRQRILTVFIVAPIWFIFISIYFKASNGSSECCSAGHSGIQKVWIMVVVGCGVGMLNVNRYLSCSDSLGPSVKIIVLFHQTMPRWIPCQVRELWNVPENAS